MEENRNTARDFICIDIGGTAIKYGVVNSENRVLTSRETPTEAAKGGRALAGKVHDLCAALKTEYPQVEGIAISTAGVINSDTAQIIHASDAIPHYAGVNYKEELSDLGLPVEAQNDVNCAGLSEWESGAANGSKSALILTIGTGIGGCFIEEGKLLSGNTYSACEVGYIPINGIPFQDQAATTALCRNVAERKKEPLSEWDGRRIFREAAEGDSICLDEIRSLGEKIGEGLAMISFILNPETIVLGGGIMAQEKVLRPFIEESFRKYSIPLIADNTRIEFASHLNEAGMKGALVHFLQKHPELA